MSEVKNELKDEFLSEIIGLTEQINILETSISEQFHLITDWKDRIERLKERQLILSNLIKSLENSEDEGS